MKNPYKVLGVSPFDSLDYIKTEYRRLCKLYHPDIKATGDAKKFREVHEAWKYIESHTIPIDSKYRWTHKTLFTVERKNL